MELRVGTSIGHQLTTQLIKKYKAIGSCNNVAHRRNTSASHVVTHLWRHQLLGKNDLM